jgi:PAS domain S-box-containing protein
MGTWTFNTVSIIYFFATGISLLLSFIAWRLRPARGAVYFSAMMLASALWSGAYVLELFNSNFEWKIAIIKIELLALAFAVYLWYVFVVVYTQFNNWINKYILVLLAIVPVYFLLGIFQAPQSSSVYVDYQLEHIGDLFILHKVHGIGFYIWTSYAYLVLGIGMVLLILRMIHLPKRQRRQIYILAPTILVLIIPNFFHLTGEGIFYPYDPSPVALALVGILFLISIYVHKFIEMMPVAHDLVFKSMRSAVIVVDSQEKILEINPAAESLFAKTQKDVQGENVFALLPECKGLLMENGILSEVKAEISLEKISRIFELKVNTLIDNKGAITGRILLLFDITEQKEAIKELDAYARTVAHDLKNPLNVISGYSQILDVALSKETDPNVKEMISGIKQGSEHMNEIVEGLLLLSQVRSLENLETTLLDMNKVVELSMNRLSSQIKESNAQIKLKDHLNSSIGIGIWVEEIFVNLLSNAIKYGGKNPEIEITSSIENNEVIYRVRDFGGGISLEEQKKLFVEFSRLKEHKTEISGHGLGLSIVKRIVEKLGGRVGVESEKGQGSAFYFSLPIAP